MLLKILAVLFCVALGAAAVICFAGWGAWIFVAALVAISALLFRGR